MSKLSFAAMTSILGTNEVLGTSQNDMTIVHVDDEHHSAQIPNSQAKDVDRRKLHQAERGRKKRPNSAGTLFAQGFGDRRQGTRKLASTTQADKTRAG